MSALHATVVTVRQRSAGSVNCVRDGSRPHGIRRRALSPIPGLTGADGQLLRFPGISPRRRTRSDPCRVARHGSDEAGLWAVGKVVRVGRVHWPSSTAPSRAAAPRRFGRRDRRASSDFRQVVCDQHIKMRFSPCHGRAQSHPVFAAGSTGVPPDFVSLHAASSVYSQ